MINIKAIEPWIVRTTIIVFVALLFFIFYSLLKRHIRKKLILHIITILSSLIAIIGIILALVTFKVLTFYETRVFDRYSWEENREDRYQMVDNLVSSGILNGKTKKEVVSILGIDSDTTKNELTYMLSIKFDESTSIPSLLKIEFHEKKAHTFIIE
jgi:ABC-type transport system involved in cytochrome bd biosynthesis fused ATPase/permease subunit